MRFIKEAHFGLPWLLQHLAWFPGRLLLHTQFHLKVVGIDNVRKAERLHRKSGRGVIFAMNHLSTFDPIIILSGILPFSPLYPMYYLTREGTRYKREMKSGHWLKHLYGNFFFYAWGSIFAKEGLKDYSRTLSQHVDLLKKGKTMTMFPEGRRRKDGSRGEAHGGTGFMINETHAIVVPVHLIGLEDVREDDFWKQRRHAKIVYGEPIEAVTLLNGIAVDDADYYRTITSRVLDSIYSL